MPQAGERVGFHYQGQYLEADVLGGLPVAIYAGDIEIEPSLDMIRAATAAVRHAEQGRA
jgi:hypothetical protein